MARLVHPWDTAYNPEFMNGVLLSLLVLSATNAALPPPEGTLESSASRCRFDCPPEWKDHRGCCPDKESEQLCGPGLYWIRDGQSSETQCVEGWQYLGMARPISYQGGLVTLGIDEQQREELVKEAQKEATHKSIPTLALPGAKTRSVRVAPFRMLVTEVTVRQYRACIEYDGCDGLPRAPRDDGAFGGYLTWRRPDDRWSGRSRETGACINEELPDSWPITGVTWNDAREFCRWLGGDLPTEEQWEYAARSAGRYLNPWGDASHRTIRNDRGRAATNIGDRSLAKLDQAAKAALTPGWDSAYDDGCIGPAPANYYPEGAARLDASQGANRRGPLNLAGNVGEWVRFSDVEETDMAPVLGGSWLHTPAARVWPLVRILEITALQQPWIGFRCALPPAPPN